MTSQKRNKIIFLLAVIVIAIGLGWYLLIPRTDFKKLTSECEKNLKKQNTDFQVCKIKKNNLIFVSSDNLDKAITPSDKFIISLNLSKLLSSSRENALTNEAIKKLSPNELSSLCFAVYPVFVPRHFQSYFSGQEIQDALQQYFNEFQWKVTTSLSLHSLKNNSNVICTDPFKIKVSAPSRFISFQLSLPSQDFFHAGIVDLDLYQYGVKVLLANKQFVNNQLSGMNMEDNILQNNNKIIPLAIFKHWINFVNTK